MTIPDLLGPVACDRDAELAKVAQRCLMAALDHSRAPRIALVDQDGAITDALVLELPPMALRLFADMLGMVAEQRPVMLVQQNHQLTIQEAAAFLNVSRPFVIKEVEAGRLKCRKVGRQRRVEFTELRRYQGAQRLESERALQELADLSQDRKQWDGRSFRDEWLMTLPLWHIHAVIGWGRPSHCLRKTFVWATDGRLGALHGARRRHMSLQDAITLYPAPLRDLLLSLVVHGLHHARWPARIHDGWPAPPGHESP